MTRNTGASAIVLAGGMSRRLGRNKALEDVGGRPLVLRALDRLSEVADDAVVVVNDEKRAEELPLPGSVRVAIDRYAGSGPLGGIFTGLSACSRQWGIVAACDMPFLNTMLWQDILARRSGHDAVVPVLDGRPEPTHAAYSKSCLPRVEERLESNDLKIARFFDEVRVAYVPQARVEELDPERLSFFNVNTQEDLDRAREMAAPAAVSVTVELFGSARLLAGRREVEIEAPAPCAIRDLVSALAAAVPALVGDVVREDGAGLEESYVLNLNGARFLESDPVELKHGDRVLLFSSQAGG